jgi:DNA-directed RNA polymerase sigma subunit (sigma70/sigma32)
MELATKHRHYLRHENFDELGAIGVEDLAQEGMVGMIEAVRTFDPDTGVRLHWYARPRIRGAICDFIMHTFSIVKIGTKEVHRKLFYQLGRTRGLIKQQHPGMPDDIVLRLVAQRLDVSVQEVIEMAARLSKGVHMSLDEALSLILHRGVLIRAMALRANSGPDGPSGRGPT